MKTRLLTAALAVLLPATAFAGTPINETRPLAANGTVDISNVKGSIKVRVWDKPEVRIGGTLGSGVERLEIRSDDDDGVAGLKIEVKYPRSMVGRSTEPTDLVIDVPVRASLEIDGVSADIDVLGTAGRELEINSVSGNVTVAGAPVTADVESVSGNLRLTLNSADVDAQTVSGDLQLRGRLNGEVDVETVSGNVTVDSNGERLRKLSSETVSGDANLRIGVADGGSVRAETVSGDITLRAPKSLSATATGTSFSGSLRAPGAKVVKESVGPGESFRQTYGSGAAEIRLETFSGDASLMLE